MVFPRKKFTILFIVLSVLIQLGCLVVTYLNNGNWIVNIISFFLPGFIAINFLIIVLIAIQRLIIVSSMLLVTSVILLWKPITETFSVGYWINTIKNSRTETIDVMSFNASGFNKARVECFMKDDSLFKRDFFDLLTKSKNKPEIICFQEFHHDDADNQRMVDEIVERTDLNYFYMVPMWMSEQNGFFGIMTMSKYPIVNKGTLFVGENIWNRGIYTDILYKNDTIRIINIHLHSMNIRLNSPDSVGFINKYKTVIDSLISGSIKSKKQIDQVLTAITESKYPVLLCGDFNSFPFGYSYQQVKKLLNNSFEKAGRGFGFTLNISPYFVRIDNQFYSDRFVPIESKVMRGIKQSDHFPIFGRYIFKPKTNN